MSRLIVAALLLTSCAAEVAPRAEPGDPRVLPVGAVAALDGSFSEGDGLSYAWSVAPAEGATLTEPTSPFASITAKAPGFYTLSLEVCDEAGRCDVAETWARVDGPGSADKVSDWGLGEFAGAESGAGAPFGVAPKSWCDICYEMCHGDRLEWEEFCRNGLPKAFTKVERAECWNKAGSTSSQRERYCDARCAE
ncbi:hypothetical protein L6R46_28385 [Myxococcota bacterium]|nr:hypothetical protein [Myxococcota bacterium]